MPTIVNVECELCSKPLLAVETLEDGSQKLHSYGVNVDVRPNAEGGKTVKAICDTCNHMTFAFKMPPAQ